MGVASDGSLFIACGGGLNDSGSVCVIFLWYHFLPPPSSPPPSPLHYWTLLATTDPPLKIMWYVIPQNLPPTPTPHFDEKQCLVPPLTRVIFLANLMQTCNWWRLGCFKFPALQHGYLVITWLVSCACYDFLSFDWPLIAARVTTFR